MTAVGSPGGGSTTWSKDCFVHQNACGTSLPHKQRAASRETSLAHCLAHLAHWVQAWTSPSSIPRPAFTGYILYQMGTPDEDTAITVQSQRKSSRRCLHSHLSRSFTITGRGRANKTDHHTPFHMWLRVTPCVLTRP